MSSHGAALAAPPRGSMKDGFSFGMAILGLALLVAIIGPSLVPHDPLTQELAARNRACKRTRSNARGCEHGGHKENSG